MYGTCLSHIWDMIVHIWDPKNIQAQEALSESPRKMPSIFASSSSITFEFAPAMSTSESPHISANQPHISAKEPCISSANEPSAEAAAHIGVVR